MSWNKNNQIIQKGLILHLDSGNIKSYPGEPTTNLVTSHSIYGLNGIAVTYIGMDNGWMKFSLNGTWASGTYPYCMAITGYDCVGGVTYSTSILIKTNVLQKFDYKFTGINYVNMPMDKAGTNLSTTLPDGSIFVSSYNFQYVSSSTQSGYLVSKPLADGTTFSSSTDFVWIKNLQIENKDHYTPYVSGTRSTTGAWKDLSISKNNADLNSCTTDPTVGNIITMDGVTNTGSYAQVGTSIPFGVNNFTFSSWFRTHSTASKALIALASGSYGVGLFTSYSGSYVSFTTGYSGSYKVESTTTPTNGTWYNAVGVRSGLQNKIYINGVLQGTITCPDLYDLGSYAPTIGRMRSGQYEFDGDIALTSIYSRDLTDAEVLYNFNVHKKRFGL